MIAGKVRRYTVEMSRTHALCRTAFNDITQAGTKAQIPKIMCEHIVRLIPVSAVGLRYY